MPFEIKFENIPAGISLTSARAGESLNVRTIEFVSEEDGDTLIERLEGFGSEILSKLPREAEQTPIQPSQVQELLAIIRRDGTATVYLNELNKVGRVQPKREFKAGDSV